MYGLDDRGTVIQFPVETSNFFLPQGVQLGSVAHPTPLQWVPGVSSRRKREPYDTLSSSSEVKSTWTCTSIPTYALMPYTGIALLLLYCVFLDGTTTLEACVIGKINITGNGMVIRDAEL
jgi:hypothetical protein